MTEEPRPAWIAPWMECRYASKGRGPRRFDCWGFVRAAAAARWNVELPSYLAGYDRSEDEREVARAIAGAKPEWTEIPLDAACAGDVLEMRCQDGRGGHVGLLVEGRWVLHMVPRWGVVCERLDTPVMRPRIIGAFRWPRQERPCTNSHP